MPKNILNKFNPFYSLNLYCYDELFNSFNKLCENNTFPRVTLLSGDKGLGKFTFIHHFINFFFSKNIKNNYDLNNFTINKNNDFYKNILSNLNENFYYIGRNENKNVSIENIRELKIKLSTNPLNNLPRFIIFDDADLLNQSSANALLKLIEEPTSKNFFILINNKRKKIIDTLKSRSLEFKIFLNKSKRSKILNQLLKNYNLTNSVSDKFLDKSSPGILLHVYDCMIEENINLNKDIYSSIELLLFKYKKSKNDRFIETIKFLFNFFVYNKVKSNSLDSLKLLFLKNEVNKIIYQYENFNLSNNVILDMVNKIPKNA